MTNSGRRSGPGISSTTRRDRNGNEYGATITALALHRNQDFSPKPKGPVTDADYSTCQTVNALTLGSGITAGSNTAPPSVAAAAAVNTPFVMTFSFQDIAQAANFEALFDQFRFDKVEVKFVPHSNSVNLLTSASPNNGAPTLFVVADFDDEVSVTTVPAIGEYDNVQAAVYGEGIFVTLKPAMSPALYTPASGGSFTGTEVERAGWIALPAGGGQGTTAPHFGIKGLVSGLATSSTETCIWNVYMKYYLSFRNTR